MPLSGEQAYRRPESFLLELNAEEFGYLDACIEDAMVESFECQNMKINKKLGAIKAKIELLKYPERNPNAIVQP